MNIATAGGGGRGGGYVTFVARVRRPLACVPCDFFVKDGHRVVEIHGDALRRLASKAATLWYTAATARL